MTRVMLTYREYATLPDDGRRRYEIHDGELSVTPAPGTTHAEICRRLFRVLDWHVLERALGTVWFAPVDVVQPDIVFVGLALIPATLWPAS